jgi:hypothetical protein
MRDPKVASGVSKWGSIDGSASASVDPISSSFCSDARIHRSTSWGILKAYRPGLSEMSAQSTAAHRSLWIHMPWRPWITAPFAFPGPILCLRHRS